MKISSTEGIERLALLAKLGEKLNVEQLTKLVEDYPLVLVNSYQELVESQKEFKN